MSLEIKNNLIIKRSARAISFLSLLLLTACTGPPTATEVPAASTAVPSPTEVATPAVATETPQPTPAPTGTAEPLASLLVPEFTVTEPEIIYTKGERDALGLVYWPDGNIGLLPIEEGQTAFFAANSIKTARTMGTLEEPAAAVTNTALDIQGVSDEYAYSAGGPVFKDSETGLLLIFYHAERHFGGSGASFYSEIGMAASMDDGQTFQDLGIILTPHEPPTSAFTAEIGGGTFTIWDGAFYVYFRDVLSPEQHNNLAVARATIEEVVHAALEGMAPDFRKYYQGEFSEPGRGGLSTALERGNPLNRWMSVTYNTTLERFLTIVAETTPDGRTSLHLIVSEDGVTWSPRVPVLSRAAELFYPSIIGTNGYGLRTGETFFVYYTASENWQNRWADADLERIAVTLSGSMVELPHQWEFEAGGDPEGWTPLNQIARLEVTDGSLVVEPSGRDPYMISPFLGLSTDLYTRVEVRMKTDRAGIGQFFFTSSAAGGISESNSRRFDLTGDGSFHSYTIDMTGLPGWQGHLSQLRFDPTDQSASVTIDYIRLLP